MGRALGLDFGEKRIGVALADPLGITAQALQTLQRKGLAADLEQLAALCREQGVQRVVVGLPLNMDGSEGPKAAQARSFAESLSRKTGLPIELWDERLSTVQAERVLLEADLSRAKRRKAIDRLAAQVILQSWLDARAARTLEEEER